MSTRSTAMAEKPFGLLNAIAKAASKPTQQGNTAKKPVNVDPDAAAEANQELWPLPGLAPMTRVRTSFGDVHAVALRKGDEVLTKSGEYKKIVWINRIMLDEHILNLKPDSNPVVLAQGSLGPNAPAQEIMVSPRQVIADDQRSNIGSAREAAMLTSRPGVRRLRETGLSYTLFHVGEAADVCCEGIYLHFPVES